MTENKPRVAFDINVVAHYRVPFFLELSKYCDLLVIVSNNKTIDGLKDVQENLPFKTIRLKEIAETSFVPTSTLYHADLLQVLKDHRAEIIISFSTSIDRMMINKEARGYIKTHGIKTIWMGCDGYRARNPILSLLLELVNPRHTLRTIRSILALSRVDYFLPYSSHTAKYLRQARFVPANKIGIAQNAIDTRELNSTYRQLKQSGRKRDPLSLVFAGRLTPGKKVDVLLEAFAEVAKRFPEATLNIVGEGSEENRLKQMAKKLSIAESTNFLGPIYKDSLLAEQLYSSSIFVMPGLGGLGFNTAMAVAMPIIYTHADGTEEDIITDSKNGWYFDGSAKDLATKMELALSSTPAEIQAMGDLSETLITQKFNLDNLGQAYKTALYKVSQAK